MKFSTRAIHAGNEPDPVTGAIMVPIYQTSTYVQEAPAKNKGYEYSRTRNPTRTALETNLASLESAKHALCFSSGLGAENAITHLFDSGTHVVAGNDLYGGTYRLFTKVLARHGYTFSFVDTADPKNVDAAMTAKTQLVWLETPTNPLLRITDIAAVAKAAKAKNPKAIIVVDNTFATPYLQSPLALGADIVVHSATKYLGGHSDVVGGCLMVNDDELRARLAFLQNSLGAVPAPMDCFLLLRGTKTLAVRMDAHCKNAMAIAKHLSEDKRIARVYYPGLASDPGHAVAKKQMSQFGGMISFDLAGTLEQSVKFVSSTKLFSLAESLGGVESLIEHPAVMTHASVPAEERRKNGLADGLVRASVGIEDVSDLIADLDMALSIAFR
jgi:cystathionine beta-lyase/cystathionine gamma-synthase